MFLFSLRCWLREQGMRKFKNKDFMSDKREVENERQSYTGYEGN